MTLPVRAAVAYLPAGVLHTSWSAVVALSCYLKYVVVQLIVELCRWISVGALAFQAAPPRTFDHDSIGSAPLRAWGMSSALLEFAGSRLPALPTSPERVRVSVWPHNSPNWPQGGAAVGGGDCRALLSAGHRWGSDACG